MATQGRLARRICFGEFELDLETAELRNGEKRLILPGKPFQVLKALLEQPGELVGRQELIERLWPDGTFVDFDQSLNKAVNRLREALNDSADAPRLIETLPRKGYRFIGELFSPGSDFSSRESSQLLRWPESETKGVLPRTTTVLPLPAMHRLRTNAWEKSALWFCVAVALAGGAWLIYRQFRQDRDWVQVSRLTDSGQVADLALSPDGRFFVYASRSGQFDSLRLREIETQADVQLLSAGPQFHGLTYSNDGREIYLLRSDPNDPFFKHLYSMPSRGGSVRKLISDVDSPVSFSPDGRQFVYEHCLQPRNDIELIISDINGEVKRPLATLHNASGFLYQPGPAWSSDGKTIAVAALSTSEHQVWTMYAISVADGSVRTVIQSPDGFGRPIWIDRRTVILTHFDHNSRTSQLWALTLSSGNLRQVTHGSDDYLDVLSATSDRRKVAGITAQISADVWSVSITRSENAQQLTHSGMPILEAAESFDGKLLVLDREGVPWMMVADGTQWTKFADLQNASRLMPCGRFVVFMVQGPQNPTLVRFDRDGTHPKTLASGHLDMPVCAADGASIFYVTTQQPQIVWNVALDGGEPLKVAEVQGNQVTGDLAVSPDAKYLAYPFTQYGHIPSDGWHIAVIPVGGGPPLTVQPVTSDAYGLYWSPAGESLQYLRTIASVTNLWEQPVFGGTPRQLTKFNSELAFRFNWSRDQQHLLITRGGVAAEAVLLNK